MVYINFLLLIILIFLIIYVEQLEKNKKIVKSITFFNFYYFLFYGIVPLYLCFLKIKNINFKNSEFFENPFLGIIIILFYILTIFIHKNIKFSFKIFNININSVLYKRKIFDKKLIMLLLVILTIFIILYSSGYGGIQKALENSSLIRQGVEKPHKFSFLKRFFSISIIVSGMCYLRIKIEKKGYIQLIYSLIVVLISLFLLGGRANFIYMFIVFFFIEIYGGRKKNIQKYSKLLLSGIILFYFVKYGKKIINSIKFLFQGEYNQYFNELALYGKKNYTNNVYNTYNTFIDQFSHPVLSIYPALYLDNNNSYVIDCLSAIVSLFPGINEFSKSISYTNTFYFLGVKQSTVPPGLIAFSIYYFGILGIIIVPVILGSFFKYLDKNFQKIISKNIYIYPFYILLILQIGISVYTGDIRVDLHRVSYLIFYIVIILFYSNFKKINVR